MQGEVSPYDPLFSAHPASSSQRQSLCGTQNNLPRSDLLKHPYFLSRSGARFCSKGRRMTLLSGAARTPIKEKSAKPIFKSNAANFKVKDSRAPLAPSQKLMRCLVLPAGKETSSHWEALDLDIKTTVRYQRQCCLELWDSNGHSSVFSREQNKNERL
jgi:hypothetical protein